VHVAVVTLFPGMFEAVTAHGVTSRAVRRGLLSVTCVNPRDFTDDVHRTVDDRPYGGGPGMVMMVEPMLAAIHEAKRGVAAACQCDMAEIRVVYLSPQGKQFSQPVAAATAALPGLVLVAGRYEGLDERLISLAIDEEWSLGDYVLSGGEIAAMAVIDAVGRLLPGVLGHSSSADEDSFSDGLLDCPHYTRPEVYQGLAVPAVLLGGNHSLIRRWRRKQSLGRTFLRRPDLLAGRELGKEDKALLAEFLGEAPQG
jgi:tRNA (guanine37-N1)-methyltransferase